MSFSFAGADELEIYDNLATMTRRASAVVRGTVEEIRPGEVVGEPGDWWREVMVMVRVHEVLAGEGVVQGESVTLGLGGVELGTDIQSRFEGIKGDSGVFFLRRIGEAIPWPDTPARPEQLAMERYRSVSTQGVFLNDGGRVALAYWGRDWFPGPLSGMPFDEFVSNVRSYRA